MDAAARVECAHCGNRFEPDRYNAYHQRYCGEPECRRASKAESQRKWLAKNPDYFRGRDNCARVELWRADHPHYWRRSRRPRAGRPRPDALQDLARRAPAYPSSQAAFCLSEHGSEAGRQTAPPSSPSAVTGALQDLAFSQHVLAAAVGSILTGEPLQELIGESLGRLYIKAEQALGLSGRCSSPSLTPRRLPRGE